MVGRSYLASLALLFLVACASFDVSGQEGDVDASDVDASEFDAMAIDAMLTDAFLATDASDQDGGDGGVFDGGVQDGGDGATDAPAACVNDPDYVLDRTTGSRYRIGTENVTWLDARSLCEGEGAHLIIIDGSYENEMLRMLNPSDRVHIGLTDQVQEDVWLWVDGSSLTFERWAPNEPDDSFGEDCVAQRSDGLWDDVDCNNRNYFYACECE